MIRWYHAHERLVTFGLFALNACLIDIKDLRSDAAGAGGSAGGESSTTSGGEGGSGGGSAPCPAGMVHAHHAAFAGISFCIDATEVTETDYLAFLNGVGGDVAQTEQPPECAFNTELTRFGAGSNCPTFTSGSDVPVHCVDWCDAYAYCAWAGKRLCGALGGGPLAFDAELTTDEWQFACTGGFQTAYPYGDSGQICACYIAEEWTTQMMCDYQSISNLNYKVPVGSLPGCEGGFPGIVDMQGNASEWTNRCQPGTGSGDEHCVVRGGATHSVNGSDWFRCDNLQQTLARSDAAVAPGIRCCGDAM